MTRKLIDQEKAHDSLLLIYAIVNDLKFGADYKEVANTLLNVKSAVKFALEGVSEADLIRAENVFRRVK